MNKRQKEVLQAQLNAEKEVLEQLEKQYKSALNEINRKIKLFEYDIKMLDDAIAAGGYTDSERAILQSQKQSKVYQKQFQEALQGQIGGVLDRMQGNNYSTIEEYLKQAYTDGYLGTMYDIHGQGIPVVMPIDQAAAVKAIMTDSKISKGLYASLGVDVSKLKKTISAEITRGIATGMLYNDIARNVSNAAKAPLSRAKTIVRTEGHRVQQASTMDAQKKAKAKGADVVKQWDSSLDRKTRPSHRKLDGQIREADEPFEVNGKTADAPGYFGDPAEDCNCRCVSLTRARWALDEDELQTLQDRAEYYGLDKTDDFKDFKNKYLQAAREESKHMYDTTVVNPFVKTAGYRNLFNNLEESTEVQRRACERSRAMLEHRNGTKFEDLTFIDTKTGKHLTRSDYDVELEVMPSKRMREMVRGSDPHTIIAIHNHSGNATPSLADLNSAYKNKYKYGLIACHNGNLFKYTVTGEYDEFIVNILLDKVNRILYNPDGIDIALLNKELAQLKAENVVLEVIVP